MTPPRTCPHCGTEIPSGSRFCMLCGAKLVETCAVCGAANALGARHCLSCGTPLAPAASTERRVVSILFADIVGSTALATRMDPESVRGIIAEYFSAMRDQVSQHGGTVEKFVGDAVMAVFGLPRSHEDDPERAVRTAVAMQRRLTSLRTRTGDLHIRIGIATGEVIADADAPRTGEFMVTGEIVNLAARLQQEAPPDAIVVDDRTHAATTSFARYQPLPAPPAGDFADKRRWLVLGFFDRPKPRGLHAPLVGRTDEVQVLLALYRRMAEGRTHHLVTLFGTAGVGKTRLMEEVLHMLRRGGNEPGVLRGRCPAYGKRLAYWPLAEMLKQECEIVDSDPHETAREKLDAGVRRVCEPLLGPEESGAIAATLGTVLGLAPASRRVSVPDPREAGDPRSSSGNLLQALTAFLVAKAEARPLVLVIEDLHWGEESLLELLEHLAVHSAEAAILVVCLARPELLERRPEWGRRVRNHTAISIAPLSADRSCDLMTGLLDGEAVPADVREAILAKADGNPFFIGEILRMLVDSGTLVRGDDGWRWSAAPLDIRIPDTVHGIVASRLDLLPPVEKRAIQDASIAGRVFWLGAVTSAGLPAAEAAAALERLQERELVEAHVTSAVSGDREFVFTHALIPEVAYSTLPKAARSLKHVRFAEWFERVAQRGDEFLEVLAHHYEQAWRYRFETGDPGEELARKAIHAIRHAGSRAKDLRTLPEARRFYERALEIFRSSRMESDRALLLELLTERSEVVKWLSSPDVVLADTRTVIDGAAAIDRRDLLARAWLNRAFAEYAHGRLRQADDALRRAEELFRSLHDLQGEAEALEMVGIITEDLRGQLRAAREAYGQALALYRGMGNAQGMARTTDRAGWCLLNAGRLDEAEVTLGDALRLARDSHERISEADAVKGLAVVAHLKGDAQKAVDGYRAAIKTCLEMGDLMGAAHGHRHLGGHYLRVGRVEDAEGELGTAQALRAQHGAKGESAGILRGLAEVYLAKGDLLRAADYAERACAAVPPYDELARATYRATLGRVRASQGRAAEADALFQESLRGLEQKEYVIDLALMLLKHGDALLTLKRPESAGPVLDRARTLFAEMGATFFVRQLDARVRAAHA